MLKPFLIGENLKRWHVESDDLWLIYTPKNRIAIDDYPAVRDHLARFRQRLEARATKQEWWELQQAQAAYEDFFSREMIVWRDISRGPTFSWIQSPSYVDCTGFFLPRGEQHLLGFLGSKAFWFQLAGMTPIASGGYARLKGQYFKRIWPCTTTSLQAKISDLSNAAYELSDIVTRGVHRLADLNPAIPTTAAFRQWPALDFAALRALIQKRFRHDIPIAERDQWEGWYAARRAEAAALRARIADAEAEINARVYALFDLTGDEIAAIEDALAGQY